MASEPSGTNNQSDRCSSIYSSSAGGFAHSAQINGLIDSSWFFLGLCIQLYVQNWPLRALLWHLWSTGTYFFIKYTYC